MLVLFYNVQWTKVLVFINIRSCSNVYNNNEYRQVNEVLHAPHLGSVAIGVIYVCFGLGCLIVTPIIEIIEAKWSMFIAAVIYAAYIAGNVTMRAYFLL